MSPDPDTRFSALPNRLCNIGYVTASASTQGRSLLSFGPQLINHKNETKKKIPQGTLINLQKSYYSNTNYYRLSPSESLLEMGRHYAT